MPRKWTITFIRPSSSGWNSHQQRGSQGLRLWLSLPSFSLVVMYSYSGWRSFLQPRRVSLVLMSQVSTSGHHWGWIGLYDERREGRLDMFDHFHFLFSLEISQLVDYHKPFFTSWRYRLYRSQEGRRSQKDLCVVSISINSLSHYMPSPTVDSRPADHQQRLHEGPTRQDQGR